LKVTVQGPDFMAHPLDIHTSTGAGTIGETVADIASGLSLTSRQETKRKNSTDSLKI
jgi:hypothetical protein